VLFRSKKQFGEDVVSRTLNYEEYHSKNGKEGFYFYFERFSVLTEDQVKEMDDQKIDLSHQMNDKIPIWLPLQETDLFQDWAAQKEDTLVTAIKYPLQYLAFYHYDPRRWSVLENGGTAVPRDEAADRPYFTPPGNWDEPFKEIATADKPGTFIGFKMYTALGYKPLDPKLSGTLNAFYGRCQEENIPIMCHCSPSGMWSHDKDHYFNSGSSSHKDNYGYKDRKWYTLWFWSKKEYQADVGFYDAFVRPTAWETQVLSKYPDLKLCLAHFGGGSTEWAAWKNDTESKIRLYKKIKINETRNSNITVTPEEKDVLIASYFNRYENPAERTYKGKKTLPKWYYDHDADTGLSEDLWSKL
jgi:predicted TIM-barrel fold metal-dependent hydrolase